MQCYCIDEITWTLEFLVLQKYFTTERGRGRRNGREIRKTRGILTHSIRIGLNKFIYSKFDKFNLIQLIINK